MTPVERSDAGTVEKSVCESATVQPQILLRGNTWPPSIENKKSKEKKDAIPWYKQNELKTVVCDNTNLESRPARWARDTLELVN